MNTLIILHDCHNYHAHFKEEFFIALWIILTVLYAVSVVWRWHWQQSDGHVVEWSEVFFPSNNILVYILHFLMSIITIAAVLISASIYLMQYL